MEDEDPLSWKVNSMTDDELMTQRLTNITKIFKLFTYHERAQNSRWLPILAQKIIYDTESTNVLFSIMP